jgi:hypothetical protein
MCCVIETEGNKREGTIVLRILKLNPEQDFWVPPAASTSSAACQYGFSESKLI